jgi:ATP-dependent helicase/nuclease subunit B
MAEELRGYLRRQREAGAVCSHFELAFGMEDAQAADPASRREPVAMKTPRGPVLLRGRIDRVDELHGGEARGPLVIDYKTGRLPSEADLKEGRNLQMPVYIEAVEQILLRPCPGGVFHHVADAKDRHFSELKAPRKDPRPFRERRTEAVRLIGEFVAGIRGGRFDALPSATCPSYCPFREICQHADARAELKEGE